MKGPWDLDMRDNDFTEADTVHRAVCANATKLRSLNNLLTLKNDESKNLRDSLQRNMYLVIRAWISSHSLQISFHIQNTAKYPLEVEGCQ